MMASSCGIDAGRSLVDKSSVLFPRDNSFRPSFERSMLFPIFPGTLKYRGDRVDKVPLVDEWGQVATRDEEQIREWQNTFKDKLKHWAVPTGPRTGILVLDVDVKGGGIETASTLAIPDTMSQRTPSGGIHYIFKYPDDGHRYQCKVKFLPGLDTRGDGGYIFYYGVDDKPIADAPSWLLDACREVPISNENAANGAYVIPPEIAKGELEECLERVREAPEGEGNNVLNVESFKVGQLVASGGLTRVEAEGLLFAAAVERGRPEYEARATIKSGLDGGMKKPLLSPFPPVAPEPAFSIPAPPPPPGEWVAEEFSMEDLMDTSSLKKPQLFKDWSTRDIHITTADGGTGKTTLKVYEAICLALGERFLGFDCIEPGVTLYITGEDDRKKFGSLIASITRQMGLHDGSFESNRKMEIIKKSIFVIKEADMCLITKDKFGFINMNDNAMTKVMQAVHRHKPKMIVFDPISSFWGSEMSGNDMGKAVAKFMSRLVEQSGACVEMINHMGKVSSANKDTTQFAGRGGTGLVSNARVSRVIHSMSDDEYSKGTGEQLGENESAMQVNVNKFSDGSPLYNKPFVIVRNGFLFSRKTLTPVQERNVNNLVQDKERIFKFIEGERLVDKWPTAPVVIGHFLESPDPIPRTRINDALKNLAYAGKIKSIDNPDVTIKDKAFVLIDENGKEL